ncbi:MAG TPA: hypothetical protein VHV74_05425 [Pseudonocardiaceae bacterium]|jgi:hypothetical protein|nr:hypothetical protein [Pseudonocardiaceae bacterium]
MRLRILGTGLAIGAAALATTVLAGPNAYAAHGGGDGGGGNGGGGRPCGTASATSGHGTLGSPFTLKSMYDDDGAVPGVVVGEEFEVDTPVVGQQWTIDLADNGMVFFHTLVTSDVTGIKGMSMTQAQPGGQVMTAHAVNTVTGETVDGTVTLGPPPAGCGH